MTLEEIIHTLQYMKPDIKVAVWNEDPIKNIGYTPEVQIDGKYVAYNELETFRPTKKDILSVNQADVVSHVNQITAVSKQEQLDDIQSKLAKLQKQFNDLVST